MAEIDPITTEPCAPATAPSESVVQAGYAVLEEHADLKQLTAAQFDELERAIKIALVDDDTLLTYCFNIQRNLENNPPR